MASDVLEKFEYMYRLAEQVPVTGRCIGYSDLPLKRLFLLLHEWREKLYSLH